MTRDDRLTALFLLLSVLLYVGLLLPWPWLPEQAPPPPPEPPRPVYVVKIPHTAPTSSRVPPPPVPRPQQHPEIPHTATAIQPRQPQALEPHQPRQEPAPIPEVVRPQASITVPQLPDPRQPRQGSRAASPTPTVRRQQKPPPRPQVVQRPSPPTEVEAPPPAAPRQPSTQAQPSPAPSPPAAAPAEHDPLALYLGKVRAAIDRQKRYPTAARRAGVTGQVVLQFVILPDGKVLDPSIAENHASSALGSAALDSLRRASPLPPFPEEITQDRLVVRVPISYKLAE
jgi:protein TonB